MKYTYEFLKPYVDNSISVSDVARKIGLIPNGGSLNHLSKAIKKANIDTSHFVSQAWRSHASMKGRIQRRTPESILVVDEKRMNKTPTHLLVRSLIEIGVKYVCKICGQLPDWNNKPLTLQIDHINGDIFDNRKENLRFLCPNCHSQTDTFNVRNSKSLKNKENLNTSYNIATNAICFCVVCGASVKKRNGFCQSCAAKNRKKATSPRPTKIEWPEKSVLKAMVEKSNYSQVAKTLGVSDNAIRKHLK